MATPLVAIGKAARGQPGYTKVLRSSCRYCRRRKIKCDGEAPCEACQGRSIDCVHDERARMGRPTKGIAMQGRPAFARTTITIGSLLDAAFDDAFKADIATTAFSAAVHSYLAEPEWPVKVDAEDLAEQTSCGPEIYDALFPQLVRDLLDACRWQYSSLIPTDTSGASTSHRPAYLPIGLRRDQTTQMALKATTSNHAKFEADEAQLWRLYHIWSASHPFALCASVDGMQLRQSAAQAIRCLVLLEARQMCGEERDKERVREEYRQAEELFRAEQIPVYDEGPLEEQMDTLLLACQASLLFGWHELAHNHPKRGTTYMAVAGQLMGQLHSLAASADLNKTTTLATIKTTSSLLSIATVWAFSQLDRSTGDLDAGWNSFHDSVTRRPDVILNDAVTHICSTLLNSHPSVVSSALGHSPSNEVQNLSSLAMRLYPHVTDMQLLQDTDQCDEDTQDLIELIRESIRIMLLLPSGTKAGNIQSVEHELLPIFCSAKSRLARLVGQGRHNAHKHPVLHSRLAYERPRTSAKPSSDGPLRKTVAAYTYDLLSQASERVAGTLGTDDTLSLSRSSDWQQVCASLSQAYLELLETPSLRTARETFRTSSERFAAAAAQRASGLKTPGLTSSVSPNTTTPDSIATFAHPFDFTTTNFPLENMTTTISSDGGLNDSLYNVLWGYLPWTQEDC